MLLQPALLQPATCREAVGLLATQGGVVVAGGTDVFPALVDRPPPAAFIDLSRCIDLQGIAVSPSHTRIAAGMTWSRIVRTRLPRSYAELQAAGRDVGSVQI